MTTATDPLAPLRDSGQRYWRRFTPTPELAARVALVANGSRLGDREVQDMSMGGLGVALRWRDHKRVEIGEILHIELSLAGGVPVALQAKAMHMQRRKDGLFASWNLGLMFESNVAWKQASPTMARYLFKLLKREQATVAAK